MYSVLYPSGLSTLRNLFVGLGSGEMFQRPQKPIVLVQESVSVVAV